MMVNSPKNKFFISLTILAILHLVGVAGLLSPLKEQVLYLTPMNLLISSVILLWNNQQSWNIRHISLLILFFVMGFLVEVWGVNTGWIFGEYVYGSVLGLKLWNTPLIIGLNWLMLTVASASIVSEINVPKVIKIILAATIMVALDFFIEPVAIKFDFWQWSSSEVPLQNYIGWFVISLALQTLHFTGIDVKSNKIAVWLLLIQWMFFLLLR